MPSDAEAVSFSVGPAMRVTATGVTQVKVVQQAWREGVRLAEDGLLAKHMR